MPRELRQPENQPDTRPTIVYFVRHGVTEWNLQHRFQGQQDVPLNEEGFEQAHAVAHWLVKQPVVFSGVYSSDLKRASQTAEIIAEHVGVKAYFAEALREIHVGDWQGLCVDEVNERYPGQLERWRREIDTYSLPGGGENATIVQERMYRFFEQLLEQHRGEAIVIVSHGMALTALIAAIHDWDLIETFHTNRARLGNTGVTAISIDNDTGEAQVLFNNSAEHLEHQTGMARPYDQAV